MFEEIKSKLESLVKSLPLNARDQAGINKIKFELDLLQSNHKPKKKVKVRSTPL